MQMNAFPQMQMGNGMGGYQPGGMMNPMPGQ